MIDLTLGDTELIIEECLKQGLLRNQAAYVLATAKWETAHTMKPVVEAYWLSESWRKNNLRYYPWHGRGYVQLTWRENYERAQRELGLGTVLTDTPDMALEAEYACQIIVMGMKEGWFTGKELADYITLQRSDFKNARRIVNGTDKAQQIADIAEEYDAELIKMGYGEEPTDPPAPMPPTPMPPPPGTTDPDALVQMVQSLIRENEELAVRIDALESAVERRCAPSN